MVQWSRKSEKQLHLLTPDREVVVSALVEYDADDSDDVVIMTITLTYNGRVYSAQGTDYPWIDAFVNLEKKLPRNTFIKGCVNCRHGNMCPVGNLPYEVFCTRDVVINEIQDLWDYTETQEETEKRSREYTQVCEDYVRVSKEFFTYNDYMCL